MEPTLRYSRLWIGKRLLGAALTAVLCGYVVVRAIERPEDGVLGVTIVCALLALVAGVLVAGYLRLFFGGGAAARATIAGVTVNTIFGRREFFWSQLEPVRFISHAPGKWGEKSIQFHLHAHDGDRAMQGSGRRGRFSIVVNMLADGAAAAEKWVESANALRSATVR